MEAVCLRNVHFTYADSARAALRGVSVEQQVGEMLVIMGRTGAGKSSLVKCLNRIIPAFQSGELSGEISLFGHPVISGKVGEFAGTVGMVFQDFEAQIFSTTVRDEIAFGMEQVGLDPEIMRHRLPLVLQQVGLQGFEGRDPSTLSGGEKQRLAIAAVMALQPRLLVLDEPTTDLDPQGREEIFVLLKSMQEAGFTMVVVEHELVAAQRADRIVLLHQGQVVAQGPPESLLARVEFLEQYGIHPPDLDLLFARLHISCHPRNPAHAAELLEEKGIAPLPERFEILVRRENRKERQESGEMPLLRLRNVSYVYPRGPEALHNVSLDIQTGEFIALIGENGSGKTTLAKHFNGLLQPDRGQVLLRGKDIRGLPPPLLAGEVGYVFQNPDHQLFAPTVKEEVAFGPRNFGLPANTVEDRTLQALAAVGLTDLMDHDPFLLGKGERQRLAVATILALRPRLLILDEPTTGLDYPEQRSLMHLLRDLNTAGHTIVVITHVPWVVAEYARRVILLHGGKILWDGALRALFAQADLLASASFRVPDITALGRLYGITPLTVEEFLFCVDRGSQGTLR